MLFAVPRLNEAARKLIDDNVDQGDRRQIDLGSDPISFVLKKWMSMRKNLSVDRDIQRFRIVLRPYAAMMTGINSRCDFATADEVGSDPSYMSDVRRRYLLAITFLSSENDGFH
jgi:hypothetical protein